MSRSEQIRLHWRCIVSHVAAICFDLRGIGRALLPDSHQRLGPLHDIRLTER